MANQKILLVLDTDTQPSVFDAVVAVDAGVDQLLRHGGVTKEQVRDLVYGVMFTRGGEALRDSAIFVGGSNVSAAEGLFQEVQECFFGPVRVSAMIDPNGANTTAAAAVLAAAKHVELQDTSVLVLGATGPVGSRVVRLLARSGAQVGAASRALDRAEKVCNQAAERVSDAKLQPVEISSPEQLPAAWQEVNVVIAAGAPGVQLLPEASWRAAEKLRVVIDLNAVPPLGVGGIEVTDKAVERDGVFCYGAVGVGGRKMKIHKAAVARLFEANDLALDAEEILELGADF